jgi:hypothetical protein
MTALASTATNGRQTAVTTQPMASDSPIANLVDVQRFEQLQRLATLMAHSSLTPKHLRGNSAQEAVGNCFRVANQAIRWGFDPFAVADESYVVSGKLGYQGKLVAAVINSRAGLKQNLTVTYTGTGDNRTATITGWFKSESTPRTIELSVGQAKTAHEMWKKDPDQKLFYSATIKWARRHCPEIVMGVLTDDELEAMRSGASARAAEVVAEGMATLALPAGRSRIMALPLGRSRIKKPTPAVEVAESAEEVPPNSLVEGEIVDDGESTTEPTESDEAPVQEAEAAIDPLELVADNLISSIEVCTDINALNAVGAKMKLSKRELGGFYARIEAAYQAKYKSMGK